MNKRKGNREEGEREEEEGDKERGETRREEGGDGARERGGGGRRERSWKGEEGNGKGGGEGTLHTLELSHFLDEGTKAETNLDIVYPVKVVELGLKLGAHPLSPCCPPSYR